MSLVVFLKGINVGAPGTFIVRGTDSHSLVRSELKRRLRPMLKLVFLRADEHLEASHGTAAGEENALRENRVGKPRDVDQRFRNRSGLRCGAEAVFRFRNIAGDEDRVLSDRAHAVRELPNTVE